MKITKQRLKELIKEELENMSFLEEEFLMQEEERRTHWEFPVKDMRPSHKKLAIEAGYSLSSVLKMVGAGGDEFTRKEALRQLVQSLSRQSRKSRR